ncbi:hypothetical protein ACVIJ6_007503 [Bradyrhizobium sp. USDA 4369]
MALPTDLDAACALSDAFKAPPCASFAPVRATGPDGFLEASEADCPTLVVFFDLASLSST